MKRETVKAQFEERVNRFVVRVRLDGRSVEAYLANTARLRDLLQPGAWVYVQQRHDPKRKTRYQVVRFLDGGVLVGAEAAAATEAFAGYLSRHRDALFGGVVGFDREVRVDSSRLDFRLDTADGSVWWVEVKSLSRVVNGAAHFSGTPSTRGWGHLDLLGRLVRGGDRAAAVFVVQRPDARLLVPGEETDPGWLAALGRAESAGVEIMGFSCRVTLERVDILRRIQVSLTPCDRGQKK